MRKSVGHSKYRNTGILFELLTRQVTADTLNGRENSPALNIIREYFKPTTELGKELQLYRALLEATNLSEPRALKLIDLVLDQRKKLRDSKLNEQKYGLIKAVRDAYPLKDFLSSKIPDYKIFASIYKVFVCESTGDFDARDVSDLAKSRFTIVEHIAAKDTEDRKKTTLIESYKAEAEEVRLLSYKILVDRFNEKYKSLDGKQKKLLREYINNVANTNSLRDHINTEIPIVKQEIRARLKGVDDKVVRIKLEEVLHQLDTVKKGKTVRDNQVTALMIAYEIIKEIDVAQDA
jgi:hypothetical protein